MVSRSTSLRLTLLTLILCLSICPAVHTQSKPVIRLAANAGPEGDAVQQLTDKYPLAKVIVVPLPYDNLREQLISQLGQAQGSFDVVMIDDPWFPQLAVKLAELKNIPSDLRSDIVPTSLRLGENPYGTGPTLALPFVGNTEILFVRTDILSRLGVSKAPDDWQQVADLASTITATSQAKLGQRVYGYAIRGHAGAAIVTDFLPIYWSLGGKLLDNNQMPRSDALNKAIFTKALRIYKQLADASPPGALNYDFQDMTAAFAEGRVAMEINWPTAIQILQKAAQAKQVTRPWNVTLPPGDRGPGTSMIGNWLLGVPKNIPASRAANAQQLVIWMLQNQEKVAGVVDPPTRTSIFTKLGSTPETDYFLVIRDALARSTPRDRSPYWSQIETAVSDAVTGYLAGTSNSERAAESLDRALQRLFPKR